MEPGPTLGNSPFDRPGMWVWYVDRSEGGSAPAMVARARRSGIGTVYDFTPYRMQWSASRARTGSSGAVVSRARPARRPLSATLAPKADEIRPGGP